VSLAKVNTPIPGEEHQPSGEEAFALAERKLVYEIFVDRFAGPNGAQLRFPSDSTSPWQEHCGGTLDGIASRLDHLRAIGADALYLTPIFPATTNHKYNASTYEYVEPAFGGDAAFDVLARECRRRGMGLILDGVFNHVGTEHSWFLDASSPGSDRRSLFKWKNGSGSYDCWRGHKSLPGLSLANPALQEALFDGETSVLRHWLRRGATGWRLDCANDLGMQMCARARAAAQMERAPDGITGEMMGYAEEWLNEGCFDGVMNYYFRQSVVSMLTGEVPVKQVAYNFKRMATRFKHAALLRSWNMRASHDTPRLATVISDASRRRLAYVLQFTFPGVPMMYYGEEIGMRGGHDPECRGAMEWDHASWDRATLDLIARLSSLRGSKPALRRGEYLPMPQPGSPGVLAYARTTGDPRDVVVVLANASDEEYEGRLFLPYSYLFDGLKLVDLLQEQEAAYVAAGSVRLRMMPWSSIVFAPEDQIPNYSFFRNAARCNS